jgi:S-adenosylmethionine decarboxylase
MTPHKLPNTSPDGIHYLAEFFGCCPHQINSPAFWDNVLSMAVDGGEIQILHRHFYQFEPHGVTGYVLLSASHISIHTWPEHGYVSCDVFSCGDEDETEAIFRRIEAAVRHAHTHMTTMRRGFRFGADPEAALYSLPTMIEHCDEQEVCPVAQAEARSC